MSPARVMVEHVAELRRHLGTQKEIQRDVPMGGIGLSTATVPVGADVHLDLVLESIFEGVTVRGTITAPWEGECRRCLDPVQGSVEGTVHEVFETNPTEGETWPLKGDEIDLEPVIRDVVLLSLPLAPLCSPDCPGPAPEAYPALVEPDEVPEPEAAPPVRDPRWAALDDLDL